MAKEEQSQFIPRAFVNLPREHITAVWPFQQTEMRKVGGDFVVDMDVTRCLIVSPMKGECGGVDELRILRRKKGLRYCLLMRGHRLILGNLKNNKMQNC